MQRDLGALTGTTHDLLVVGGGVHGAVAAWDATLRGLSVALIEQADFGAATSANSLKIVHGGLRYLKQAALRRMRESILERSNLLRIAPHLVRPLAFLVATYSDLARSRAALAAALWLADSIGMDRNRGLTAEQRLPRGRLVSPRRCREIFPGFDPAGLTGGALWYDAQMLSSERLTLSFLLSAAERGAVLANYVAATAPLVRDGACQGVRGEDRLSGARLEVRARNVLNAAGPWGARWIRPGSAQAGSDGVDGPHALALNVVVRARLAEVAIGIRSKRPASRDPVCGGQRFLFMTPWRSSTLIGTSYRPFDGSPGDLRVAQEDLRSLIEECSEACPASGLSLDRVCLYHRGLVPLKGGTERGRAGGLAESALIVDHGRREGLEGVISVRGVKYTTARAVAQLAIDRVCARLGRKTPACVTAATAIYGGEVPPALEGSDSGQAQARVARRLCANHGSRAAGLARRFELLRGWCEPIDPGCEVLTGEVLHAVREEMAVKLADVVLRRTAMGSEGLPPREHLEATARIMAGELGWTEARLREEIGDVARDQAPLPLAETAGAR